MELARFTKLNNTNYDSWSFSMKALLRREKLWEQIAPGQPPNPVTDAWTSGDERALTTIQLLVEESQIRIIRDKETAKAAWDALREHHNKVTLGQTVTIIMQIANQNFQEGENMEEYIGRIEKMYARLDNAGLVVQEAIKVALILRGLPPSFKPLIMALEARDEADLTLAMVKGKLIDEADNHRPAHGQEEQAMKVGARSKVLVCYRCGKPGHRKMECPEADKESGKKKKCAGKAKQVRENDRDDGSFTFMLKSGQVGSCSWVIDSGATSHLTSDRAAFVRFDSSVRPVMSTADGKVLRTEGIGDCVLQCVDGRGRNVKITLTDVIFAPGLEGSLVSIGKLATKGVQAKFVGEKCELVFGNRVVATANKSAGLYRLNLASEKSLLVEEHKHTEECLHTWHRRLGHRDPEAVTNLERKGLASGIKVKKCGLRVTCECCIEGKMSRPPFPAAVEKRSKDVLDIVHSDVCGPMTTSPGGCKYYMTMIDDHSRYTVVYFLKAKSEVEEKIRQYVRFVQNQFGRKPKVIRSDRGGEYTGNSLRKFYAEEGIKAEFTAGYAPQQNGVAERKNRSLNEMGLCMLLDSGLERKFWAEAVNTATYIQNRLPSKAIERTPYEIWFGTKPDVKHMKVFGCSAYVWTPPQKRKKLDAKSEKMVFVGYSSEHKAYRLLDPKSGKIVVSRDVRFLELTAREEPKAKAAVADQAQAEEVDIPLSGSSVDEESDDEFFGFDEDDSDQDEEQLNDVDEPDDVDGPDVGAGDQEEQVQEEQVEAVQLQGEPDGGEPPLPDPNAARRSTRQGRGVPPQRYEGSIGVAVGSSGDPRTFAEAVSSVECAQWKAAMEEEMAAHRENGTWELTKLPANRRAIGCKWVFKRKEDETGKVARYKARLVAQGFSQQFGSDYDQVFAPVVKQVTLRAVLTLASKRQMLVRHIDIRTAYLYGELQEELYMRQPPGYSNGDASVVCRLVKSLYGLKQAARVWNHRIDEALKGMGFKRSCADQCLYIRGTTCVLIYVDDIVVACHDEKEYKSVVKLLRQSFKVVELSDIKFFLGIHVRKQDGHYVLSQRSYISKVLVEFGMDQCKASKIPMASGFLQQREEESATLPDTAKFQSLIGALLYIAVNTRPDICIATSILGRRVTTATEADWTEAKKVLRYLKGTLAYELHLGCGKQLKFECFVDADWAGEATDRKSNSGFIFKLGGGLLGWCCRKQSSVALSSIEAEYVALAECLQELLWLRKLMVDLSEPLPQPIVVFEDNQSCIALTAADRTSRRSKHIDTKFCFVKDLVKEGVVTIKYCPSDQMEADLLTKPLGAVKLQQLRAAIGVKCDNVEEEC